ncbi:MAG: CpsD/CapB family tyrosine-protein kinase [Bryobacteraceae bacterium]
MSIISISPDVPAAPRSEPVPAVAPAKTSLDPSSPWDLSRAPVHVAELTPASRIAPFTQPRGPGSDRFRYLRMRLRELRSKTKLTSILITSPLPRDGKSTVALNLATSLADGGQSKVLLIEGDLHRPTLAKSLGLPARSGFAECIESGLDPLLAIVRIEPLRLYLLPAGDPKGNAPELLQSQTIGAILSRLAETFDWIVIDSPPLAPLSDAVSLSRQVDATLLVVHADRTPREAVDEALSMIGPNRIAGIILNGAQGLNRLYSKYGEYYGKK